MYGYNLIGAQYGQSAQHANAHALANRHNTGLTLDEAKAWLEQETAGVKRKYLVLGAAALGVGYYGYTKGWFR